MGWAFTVSVPSVFITLLSVLVILPYGFPLWNLQKHREKVTPLSLFTFNDQVRSLGTMHEVENMLNEKNDVDMILFYAHWCGHCQKFAPHFRKFAEDVRGWWPVLHIGAVNCAVSSDICSHYNVTFYPAIQLFWKEESAEGDRPVEIMDTLKYELLHAAVIDFIEKHVKSGVASRVLPDLSPNRAKDISDIWLSVPSTVTLIVAVVEKRLSYIGREVILDLCGFDKNLVSRTIKGSAVLAMEVLLFVWIRREPHRLFRLLQYRANKVTDGCGCG